MVINMKLPPVDKEMGKGKVLTISDLRRPLPRKIKRSEEKLVRVTIFMTPREKYDAETYAHRVGLTMAHLGRQAMVDRIYSPLPAKEVSLDATDRTLKEEPVPVKPTPLPGDSEGSSGSSGESDAGPPPLVWVGSDGNDGGG